MAKNKKSFILYADLIHTFNELTDDEAGKLIKHVLAYVNDLNPQTENKLIKIAFEPIRQQLKRDLSHWENIKEKRSKAGQASAEARKQNATLSTHFDKCQQASTLSTVNVNDNVNVNVNVTDTVKESSNAREVSIENSNLFRKPNIPTLERVIEFFEHRGGTREMAEKFFNKYEGIGWYVSNSPITDFRKYATSYIDNWKQIDSKSKHSNNGNAHQQGNATAAKLGTSAARERGISQWGEEFCNSITR